MQTRPWTDRGAQRAAGLRSRSVPEARSPSSGHPERSPPFATLLDAARHPRAIGPVVEPPAGRLSGAPSDPHRLLPASRWRAGGFVALANEVPRRLHTFRFARGFRTLWRAGRVLGALTPPGTAGNVPGPCPIPRCPT